MTPKSFSIAPILVIALLLGFAPQLRAEKIFRAGAATSNVTPWLGVSINGGMADRTATHIHDELHARCVVLDDGESKLAIAIIDSCMIPREVCEEAKRLATESTGIPETAMLLAATHTHTAACSTPVFQSDPDTEYKSFLARRIADGIRRANNNLAPARIAWGKALVPDQVFNRRWKMTPGAIAPDPFGNTSDKIKMNPPRADENLISSGPTDPDVGFIALETPEGEPVALLASYSLHYVGGTGGGEISADYFGYFARMMETRMGDPAQEPPFVAILANGTSGDINNIDFTKLGARKKPYEQMKFVAGRVADEVSEVYESLEFRDWVALGSATKELELGVRKPEESELVRANDILAEAEGRALKGLAEIYARESVLLNDYPDTVPVTLQALRIGDLLIGAIPCEVFVETGLALKANSPSPATFTIELANGYNGYLPTREHHGYGGYETWRARSSYLEIGAEEVIRNTMLELFEQVFPNP